MRFLLCCARVVVVASMLLFLMGSVPERPILYRSPTPIRNTQARSDSIKIGLVAPDSEYGRAIRNAARMAIEKANRSGGFRGQPFQLITRSDEGLWGAGSNNISKLIFEDRVWAVIGSLDGRSAHIVEQVITKARVAYVSPWASDPTLAQANIPWFFRCVPDDEVQAHALIKEIHEKRRLQRVVTISDGSYDGNMARDIFTKRARAAGIVVSTGFDITQAGSKRAIDGIRRSRTDAVLLFGQPTKMAGVLRQMRAEGLKQPVFGPLLLHEAVFMQEAAKYSEPTVIIGANSHQGPEGLSFQRAYQQTYNQPPTTASAYTYDGVTVVIEAIRKSGLDRWKIRDALAAIRYEQGATGEIRFDENGNRLGPVTVIEL